LERSLTVENLELEFIPITEEEAAEIQSLGGRGRKSTSMPFLRAFIDSGIKSAKLSRKCIPPGVPAARLGSGLKTFARNHKLPVDVIVRGGELYLFRLEKPLESDDKE
jgi:hypothetical protein